MFNERYGFLAASAAERLVLAKKSAFVLVEPVSEDLPFYAVNDERRTRFDIDLPKHTREMVLYGPIAKEKSVGDCLVGQSRGNEARDCRFSLRELV